MYHSVTFTTNARISSGQNTYSTWHLVPESRPVIVMPEVYTNFIEIPGMSGSLDMSEYLTGYPTYKRRNGSLKFHVLNDYRPWNETYQIIATYLHGRNRQMVLEDDPDYYYEGKFNVASWTSNNDGTWSDIEIGYDLDPYKYFITPYTLVSSLSPTTTKTAYTVSNNSIGIMPTIPVITVSGNSNNSGEVFVEFTNSERGITDKEYTMEQNGTYKFYDMIVTKKSASNVNKFNIYRSSSFNGKITITLNSGDL